MFRLDSTATKACYIVDSLAGYPVHAQVDSGSTATLVWSKLLLPIPEDALKQTVISFTGEIAVTLQILDQTITLNALVYDKAPVDEFLGCNCPNFRTILHHKAEDLQELFVVKTRQQIKEQQKTRQIQRGQSRSPTTRRTRSNSSSGPIRERIQLPRIKSIFRSDK